MRSARFIVFILTLTAQVTRKLRSGVFKKGLKTVYPFPANKISIFIILSKR
jgi:hypothetical protein